MTPIFLSLIVILAGVVAWQGLGRHGELVVVTTKQGDSIRGVRLLTFRAVVQLRAAQTLSPASPPVDLGGRIEIPSQNVAMIQRLAPVERELAEA